MDRQNYVACVNLVVRTSLEPGFSLAWQTPRCVLLLKSFSFRAILLTVTASLG